MKQAENHTNAVLQESYRNMADQTTGLVRELFTDVALFLLGSELSVDDLVQRFFDALFPVVYNHLINPGLSDIAPGYAECVRLSSRDVRPFGGAPSLLADQIARSGFSGKLLLQALHLGIEVINTTDHLQFSRECRRALLKMHYCPHCQVWIHVTLSLSITISESFYQHYALITDPSVICFTGLNPVQALHGLLPQCHARVFGKLGRD